MVKPFVVGHRGAAGYEPENTARSFWRAIEMGVQYIETDVRETRDRELVLMHDPRVDRTTNGKGRVKDLTLAEIRGLDAGKGEKVPLLSEAIGFAKTKKVGLFVEIKEPGTEERIASALEGGGIGRNSVIVSFFHKSILAVKAAHPSLRCGVIFSGAPVRPLQLALDANAEILAPNFNYVSKQLVDESHDSGLLVQTWTVNNRQDAEAMIATGVDGIASDLPDIVLAAISK